MVQVNFGHYSDKGRSGQISAYSLVNGYVSKQGEGAKAPLAVYSVPGFARWDSGSYLSPSRGALPVRTKGLYSVVGGALVKFSSIAGDTLVAPIGGASTVGAAGGFGYVTMAANLNTHPQIAIVTEDGLYYYVDTQTDTVTLYAGGDLPTPLNVTHLDRYFIFAVADGRIFHSDLDDGSTINPLAFAYAESNADGLRGVFAHRGSLVALGEDSMEIWQNVGTQPFAFEPSRQDIDIGMMSLPTAARTKSGLIWVDQDFDVRLMGQFDPEPVGTDEIARAIRDLSDNERAGLKGDAYTFDRRECYALTSPYWTYELDLTTRAWHQRRSRARDNWLLQNIVKFNGKWIGGSQADGKHYEINPALNTEAGEPMIMRAQSQIVHTFPRGGKCHKLTVDMVTGEGSISGDDMLILESSTDGGANWVNHGGRSMGVLGERNKRIQFRQLGKFDEKGIIFALSSSAPVMRAISQVDADIRPLAR